MPHTIIFNAGSTAYVQNHLQGLLVYICSRHSTPRMHNPWLSISASLLKEFSHMDLLQVQPTYIYQNFLTFLYEDWS
jgi:hypothetical protein